jgi:hypothetical protein
VQTAKILARGQECTERELELWVEHIGPVWKQDMSWMQQALINWSKAMQAEGLADRKSEDIEKFVREGL